MTKKIIITLVLILSSLLLATYSFANNDLQKAGDSVRNVVGGAENVVEDAAKGAAGAVRNGTNSLENGANSMTNNNGNNNDNNGYNATRTSTDTGTYMGMNSTAWTWFIIAIVALAIIGLVWYYAMQNSTSNNDRQ